MSESTQSPKQALAQRWRAVAQELREQAARPEPGCEQLCAAVTLHAESLEKCAAQLEALPAK